MMISFSCPSCSKGLKAKDELAGRKVKCSSCGSAVQVPTAVPAGRRDKTNQPRPDAPDTRAAKDEDGDVYRLAVDSVPDADNPTDAPPRIGPTESFPKEAWAFLKPPQGPGEIGRLGPYRIKKVLGMGGMGVVFRGEDPQLERPVAIKAMLPELAGNDNAKQRFVREAKAAAMLKHPHIVTIYQVSDDCGVPFLVMEFLEGESLADRLDRKGALPVAEVIRIGRELAEGIGAAHEKGLIHRDLKPGNIWLESPKAHAKILDFGLARDLSDTAHLTQSGAIIGTPAFMAPEQAAGRKCDHRSDLFSLGAVFYCMATGERPFKGNDPLTLLTALAVQDPTPPEKLNPSIPYALSELILKMLEKDPRSRPQSAQQVIRALNKGNIEEEEEEGDQAASGSKHTGLIAAGVGLAILAIVLLFRSGLFSGGEKTEQNQVAVAQKDDKTPAPQVENEQPEVTAKSGPSQPDPSDRAKPAADPVRDVSQKPAEADVFAFLKPSSVTRQMSGQEVYDRLLKSSVCVMSDSGRGSGALVNKEERLVITNHHVVHSGPNFGPGPSSGIGAPGGFMPSSGAPGPSTIAGTLDAFSPIDRASNRRYRVHPQFMNKGAQYTIEMFSTAVDSLLVIEDSLGKSLAQDNDSGGGFNAKVVFTAPKDDNYQIVATSFRPSQLGAYTLRITAPGSERTVYVLFPRFDVAKLITSSSDYMKDYFSNRDRYKAKLVYSDESKDLAIVQLANLPEGVEALPLATASAKPGQNVHSVGNPGASESFWVYTSGTVRTNPTRKIWNSGGFPMMKHNAMIIETQSPTNPGDSGGPLVNEWGELVAVTQGSNINANAVNIFIDISEVKAVLQARGYRWTTLKKEPETVRTSLTGSTVVKLADLLQHEDSKIRVQAAAYLGEGGKKSKEAVPALAKSLGDKDAVVRRTAAKALGEIGSDALAAVIDLSRALSDEDRPVRVETLKAINKIGPTGSNLAAALDRLLSDSDTELQEQSLLVLGKLGADAKHALPGLKKIVEGSDPKLVKLALATLEQLGPAGRDAAPSLHKALDKSDQATKTRMVRLLTSWGTAGDSGKLLIAELKKGINSTDKNICLENLKTLETLGKVAKPVVEDIDRVYRRQKDREIRTQSLKTLAAMGPAAGDAVHSLIRDLYDQQLRFDDKPMHDQIRQTLVKIGLPAAEGLVQTLTGQKLSIPQRTVAYEVVGEIGPEAAAVRADLMKLTEKVPDMQKLLKATIGQLTR